MPAPTLTRAKFHGFRWLSLTESQTMSNPGKSNVKGALLALGAFALFASHDVAVKTLGADFATFQIVFFSVLLSFPLVVLMLMRDPTHGTLIPVHPWWTALRTLAAIVTGSSAFYAFSVLPLAETYAILFATPLLITVLSIPILGERVGPHRWGAVIVGLISGIVEPPLSERARRSRQRLSIGQPKK